MASNELVWAGPFLFGVTKGRNRPQWPNSPTLLMSSRNRTNWSIRSPRPMPPPPLPTTVRRSLFLSARRRAALALRAGAGTRGPWEMHIGIAALWALILPLPDAAWAFRVARRSTAVARRRSIRPVGGGRRYATSRALVRGDGQSMMAGVRGGGSAGAGARRGPGSIAAPATFPIGRWLPAPPYRGQSGAATRRTRRGRDRAHVRTHGGADDLCGGPTGTGRIDDDSSGQAYVRRRRGAEGGRVPPAGRRPLAVLRLPGRLRPLRRCLPRCDRRPPLLTPIEQLNGEKRAS